MFSANYDYSYLVEVGDYVIVPTLSGTSSFKHSIGRVLKKTKHFFVLESMYNSSINTCYHYLDILIGREHGDLICPSLTGLDREVHTFEKLSREEALVVIKNMRENAWYLY